MGITIMDRNKYREELREWICKTRWKNPFAITLTMKQKFNGIWIDNIIAQNQIKNFLNRISNKILGNNYKRRGELQRVSTLETKGRLHSHLFVDIPEKELSDIRGLCAATWDPKVIDYANRQQKVAKVYSVGGWVKYITKFEEDKDDIDILNSYLDPANATASDTSQASVLIEKVCTNGEYKYV